MLANHGCTCTPAYVTGDRTASITVTDSDGGPGGGLFHAAAGPLSNFVDGAFVSDPADVTYFANAVAVSGKWIKFDFGVGASIKVTEAKWYQDAANTHGSWKWQGSRDDSAWSDIGSAFTLGGEEQVQSELSGNTSGYRFYRLLGVSGNTSGTPFLEEIEFSQCTC
jgi:hypothetical protein